MEKAGGEMSSDLELARRRDKDAWNKLLAGGFVICSGEATSGAYFGSPEELLATVRDALPDTEDPSDLGYLLPLDDPRLEDSNGMPL
jgi:hypothetical protein